ncbi:MAG: carboxymuconolactone decarboxylase family protein [Desulfovibrionales bacterium]
MSDLPKHFVKVHDRYKDVIETLNRLKDIIQESGPIDEKTGHLIQLAAAAAQRSEGAVHSNTRRALAAGATGEEVRHTLLHLIPTVGYPTVAAALSWADDLLDAHS